MSGVFGRMERGRRRCGYKERIVWIRLRKRWIGYAEYCRTTWLVVRDIRIDNVYETIQTHPYQRAQPKTKKNKNKKKYIVCTIVTAMAIPPLS